MTAIAALLRLMDYRHFKGRTNPEDRLAQEVATMLRVATLEGRLKATWTHIPHEVGGGGKLAAIRMALAKSMGLIAGSCDFVFVGNGFGGWIELKDIKGSLSPAQKDFREWCQTLNVNHAVCRSLEEVERQLFFWGVLDQPAVGDF